jgi:putative ABC transport system permease protein
MVVVALVALLILGLIVVSIFDALFRPTIRRLALRNVVRRRGEALLVVTGSLLGTAIITASFIMGGTVGASIRDFGRTQLGPSDEAIRVPELRDLDGLEAALRDPIPGTDGTLRVVTTGAAVATTTAPRRAEPSTVLMETDFDAARRFGGDPGATGFAKAGATPKTGEIVLSEKLANQLKEKVGSSVDLYAYGQKATFRVTQLLPELGMAGYGRGLSNAFVAPGTIAALFSRSTLPNAARPDGLVFVSNQGGVFGGAKLTDAVAPRLRERVKGVPGADVQTVKQDLLDQADLQGKSLTQLFGSIGAFSVIAGILLLVNIFVMLSEERKSELGMLRAVGLKRNQLVRTFGLEGGIYAGVSAVAGAIVGIGVGRAIVWAAQSVFASGDDRFSLNLRFTVAPANVIGGMLVGGLIAFVTVWGTSIRIGRLNVIQAIRDLQDQPLRRVRLRTLIFGVLGVLLGGVLFAQGVSQNQWFGALTGVPVAAFSAIPLLSRLLSRRAVVTVACAVALAWGVLCFNILPKVFETADIPAFVVQGVILVSAAVAILATNAETLAKSTNLLSVSGRTLAARLAFAYPLARRFRTSMLLGMYAIVIFTITFIATFSNLFAQQTPRLAREAGAGYDVLVESNRANPISLDTLKAQRGVEAVAPLLRAFTEFSNTQHPEPSFSGMSGFDERLLARGVPGLGKRLPRFTTERAAWEAVLHSDNLAMISDFFLQQEGGPPNQVVHAGDQFTMFNNTTGEKRSVTVAGVVSNDTGLFNGVFMAAPAVQNFLGRDAVPSRFYVAASGNADDVATRLQGGLLENGVEADSFLSLVTDQARQQQGFLRLMEGYLGLGLVIGIAGLGVVMVRAVRERRRQIGMLRAMGFQHRLVRTAFLLEATFIALQGMVVGISLALLVSYSLLTHSDAFGSQHLNFSIPWSSLIVVVIIAMIASLAAVLAPANQASKIKPAVALRIAD